MCFFFRDEEQKCYVGHVTTPESEYIGQVVDGTASGIGIWEVKLNRINIHIHTPHTNI